MGDPETKARRCLYVGGLDERVSEDTLRAAFLPFGELLEVQVPMDHVAQKNRGFGFVEFAEEGDAADAMENMDNAELFGRVVRVNRAQPQRNKSRAVWEDADAWFKSLKEAGGLEEGGGEAAAAAAAGPQ